MVITLYWLYTCSALSGEALEKCQLQRWKHVSSMGKYFPVNEKKIESSSHKKKNFPHGNKFIPPKKKYRSFVRPVFFLGFFACSSTRWADVCACLTTIAHCLRRAQQGSVWFKRMCQRRKHCELLWPFEGLTAVTAPANLSTWGASQCVHSASGLGRTFSQYPGPLSSQRVHPARFAVMEYVSRHSPIRKS